MCGQLLRHVQLLVTPWTVASQAPLSMRFSRQECWSGMPFPSPGDLLTQGSNPGLSHFLHWQADSLLTERLGKPTGQLMLKKRKREN